MNCPQGKGDVPFRSFQEAVYFLEGGANLERKARWTYSAKRLDLGRVERLLEFLGNPHRSFRSIHVAGTKGKGSTAVLIASCLQAAGYKTGLFTSPHLVSPCERMRVNGNPVPEDAFCRLLGKVRDYVAAGRAQGRLCAPTYFEILTALGFEYFRQKRVEWAVVEVGLGGRLDSTNVLLPECCVITPIGFDHTDKLGTEIESIAAEKAGIMKPGVPVVLSPQRYAGALEVLKGRAEACGCTYWEVGREVRVVAREPVSAHSEGDDKAGWRFSLQTPYSRYTDLFVPFFGVHQVENCATAVAALELLKQAGRLRISPADIHSGIAAARWPARIEVLQKRPLLILDSAHTVESVEALVAALQVHFAGRAPMMVFGCSQDKNLAGMLRVLRQCCRCLTATQADSPRAVPADQIARAARECGIKTPKTIVPAPKAVRETLRLAGQDDMVCVTGSFFIAGEVRADWMQRRGKQGI